jgi:hypothetical protein
MPARADENGPYRDIHNRKITYERSSEALTASNISEGNRQLILSFVRHKKVAENVSVSRQTKYLHYLRILAEMLGKNFDEATTADLEDLLEKAYCRPVKRGETIKEGRNLRVMLTFAGRLYSEGLRKN